MDPLVEYIQDIYMKKGQPGRFVVNIAETATAMNTKVFIPDHRIIISAIKVAIKKPHTSTVNAARTHIEVAIIGN
jgi:hypothetical protein